MDETLITADVTSENVAKEKFEEIQRLFKKLSDDMCKVVESYYIWETLVFSRAIPEVGKETAERNLKIVNQYKDFFIATEHSHMDTFIVGISKFFDNDSRALSLSKLIERIKESENIITADFFKMSYPERFFPDDFQNGYKPLHEEDLEQIAELRSEQDVVIETLKTIRNKQVAHNDLELLMNKIAVQSFVPNEVKVLIEAIQVMFNKLSGRFESSSTMWDHLKSDAISDTKYVLENLERGEKVRQKEVEEKWKSGL